VPFVTEVNSAVSTGLRPVYERRRRESNRIGIRNRPFVWLGDRFLWLLTGYGVQLWRLLVVTVAILVLGTCIFQRDGAVDLKPGAQPSSLSQLQADPQTSPSLSWGDAFWLSLRLFLPVAPKEGVAWEPSYNEVWEIQTPWGGWGVRFATVATLVTLVGWIVVPLGVAGLTGLLKR
jgi:hypothetical protein